MSANSYQMSKGTKKMVNGAFGSAAGGLAFARIGGAVVAGVCALGGSFFGPAGTFFGYAVGTGAGAAVGGMFGSVLGLFVGINDD